MSRATNPLVDRIEQLRQEYNSQLRWSTIRESLIGIAASLLLTWCVWHRWPHALWVLGGGLTLLAMLVWMLRERVRRHWVSPETAIETMESKLELKERLLTAREYFHPQGPAPRMYAALMSDLDDRLTSEAMARWFPRDHRWTPMTKGIIGAACLALLLLLIPPARLQQRATPPPVDNTPSASQSAPQQQQQQQQQKQQQQQQRQASAPGLQLPMPGMTGQSGAQQQQSSSGQPTDGSDQTAQGSPSGGQGTAQQSQPSQPLGQDDAGHSDPSLGQRLSKLLGMQPQTQAGSAGQHEVQRREVSALLTELSQQLNSLQRELQQGQAGTRSESPTQPSPTQGAQPSGTTPQPGQQGSQASPQLGQQGADASRAGSRSDENRRLEQPTGAGTTADTQRSQDDGTASDTAQAQGQQGRTTQEASGRAGEQGGQTAAAQPNGASSTDQGGATSTPSKPSTFGNWFQRVMKRGHSGGEGDDTAPQQGAAGQQAQATEGADGQAPGVRGGTVMSPPSDAQLAQMEQALKELHEAQAAMDISQETEAAHAAGPGSDPALYGNPDMTQSTGNLPFHFVLKGDTAASARERAGLSRPKRDDADVKDVTVIGKPTVALEDVMLNARQQDEESLRDWMLPPEYQNTIRRYYERDQQP